MKPSFLGRARYGVGVVAFGALMSMACSRDTPYAPLKTNEAPATAVVGGTVRDLAKRPVANAVVSLESMQNDVSATVKFAMAHPPAASGAVPGLRVTATNEFGRYAFDQVTAGEYLLQVLAEDHLGAVRTITVQSAAQTDTIIADVNLTPTGDFAGKTFLEGASTHANTIVYVEGTSYVAVTNPAASYVIHGVPVGSYTVRATHPGYLDSTRDSTITTAGQVVTLTDMTLLIDANIPPIAVASAPPQNCELDPVTLSGAGSSDSDGSITQYAWDFEDDGSVDFTSSGATASHSYTPGQHRAKLRVTDNKGAFGLAATTFTIVKADTVFVAATGSDANPGTRSLPKQTIAAGIAAAIADTMGVCPATVVVAGDHVESPAFLPDMRVQGGYDASTWTRTAGNYSVVNVQNTPALADNINGSGASTRISGFDFRAANAPGGSPTQRNSIAMRVLSSSALTFDDCRFQSGSGFAGPTGGAGTAGGNGNAGGDNGAGTSGGVGGGGGSPAGLAGGKGGDRTIAGTAGGGGCGTGGAPGATAPCTSSGPEDGQNGFGGCPGTHGPNGPAQNSNGSAGTDWTPLSGFAGLNGTAGGGGGGGGGGGDYVPDGNPACPFFVPGGGGCGGGGGGGYATSGTGGGGGGASFAMYLYNSSPSFVDCRFTTGTGEAGGDGGNGGSGGSGGAGAVFVYCCASAGGKGGNGGGGGHGGAGSGGPGGPSYCVYRAGSSNPVLTGSVFVTGSGGLGGAAGVRADNVPAAAGLNGAAGTIGP